MTGLVRSARDHSESIARMVWVREVWYGEFHILETDTLQQPGETLMQEEPSKDRSDAQKLGDLDGPMTTLM